ncbi:hypothetical protein GCM10011375_04290 [Hymenobacter qilianensis]|uniref:Uncharacterized protein n=2 Tax=Hymenobacter qilianensis TaxID=1385715 RepID=A0A7H0H048_9BACT|nr:hypothetical protein [Hymenobacter qilianensis]QNP53914.1 hypothetical protein H9L05_10525 [Hymenobacter qilianensis]GGF51972.1 hypothetical protein GCM10011375_04290 [Hymenobacter qilianensis]
MRKGSFEKMPPSAWGAFLVVLLAGLLSGSVVHGQSRRVVNGLGLAPSLQAEYALSGDDYVFTGTNTPFSTGGFDGLDLDRAGLNAGYERFWDTRWSGGATLGLSAYSVNRNGGEVSPLEVDIAPELFLRHWNTLGSFNFRQRLGVEYLIAGGEGNESRARTRLRFDLDRLLPVGRVVLRPRLSYEAFAYLRFQRDENEPKERTIDFTALRAEVGLRLSDHFDFTPWFAYQSAYSNVLQQTDIDGNVVIPGGRRNFVTPVLGLDLRYTIFKGKQVFDRRQLPTQH